MYTESLISAYRTMCIVNFLICPFFVYVLLPSETEAEEKVIPFALTVFGLIAIIFYEILIAIGFVREYRGTSWNQDNWRTIYNFQTSIFLFVALINAEWHIVGVFALYGAGCAATLWIIKRKMQEAETVDGANEGTVGLIARLV